MKSLLQEGEDWSTFEFKGTAKDQYIETPRGYFEPTDYDKISQDRTIFRLLLQTLENDILEVMTHYLTEKGWPVSTLIYDGCHILQREGYCLDEALRCTQAHVQKVTGYDIPLLEKPLYGRETNR